MSDQFATSQSLMLIGGILVWLVAFYRFALQPAPPKRSQIPGVPQWLGSALTWLSVKGEKQSSLFPPPRANTTLVKFWLFRFIYTFIYLAIYLLILFVSGLDKEIDTFFSILIKFGGTSNENVEKIGKIQFLGPVTLALVIAAAPIVPPVRWLDLWIRSLLYDKASIDAQLKFEVNRLKGDKLFHGDDEFVGNERRPAAAQQKVWERLKPDGFNHKDLKYTPGPAKAQSLWMKASLLDIHISNWERMNKYKTAFKVLTERDSKDRTVEIVHKNYEALKGNAVTCFESLRKKPEQQATKDREAEFRRDCKALLEQMYYLLARVSLKSHYSDSERVKYMGEIGFKLKLIRGGPTPDADESIALAVFIWVFISLPLWWITEDSIKTFAVGFAMFSAVLAPIFLAHMFAGFAFRERNSSVPSVAFPIVSGAVAGVIGFAVIFIVFSELSIDLLKEDLNNTEKYRWCIFLFVLAGLIGYRMRVGTYPSVDELRNLRWYQASGNLRDAIIFTGSITVLVFALFGESSFDAWGGDRFVLMASRLVLPLPFAFLIGYFIPTWYRARRAKA